MNIPEAFATYLETVTGSTLGQDLFIGEAPSSNQVLDSIWWIIASGGAKETRLISGESVKNYRVDVYYRNRDYEQVYNAMQDLEETLNCDGCTQLDGYETMDIEATTFPIDTDLDDEDRKVGLLQATLRIHKECI